MGDRLRAALILTHNRPELLAQCIAAIQPQVDKVLVIDNASRPPATVPEDVALLYIPDQPPNLARWWNIGLDYFANIYDGENVSDVAVLCDDAIVPEGWFAAVVEGMRATDTTAGSSNPFGTNHEPRVKSDMDRDIAGRMCSWAFVLDGTRPIRADTSMAWWWFDTDFDIQCRRDKGTVMIGGFLVPNIKYGEYTNTVPGLGEQTGRDREAFAAKYGGMPW